MNKDILDILFKGMLLMMLGLGLVYGLAIYVSYAICPDYICPVEVSPEECTEDLCPVERLVK